MIFCVDNYAVDKILYLKYNVNMATNEDYIELKQGYKNSFEIIKEINEELYKYLMFVINVANKHGCIFSEIIRDLRIDFAHNSDKQAGTIKAIVINYGIKKETVSIGYSPAQDFSLFFNVEKQAIMGSKTKFYQIYPLRPKECVDGLIGTILTESVVKNDVPGKTFNYDVGFTDDGLDVLKYNIDDSYTIKPILTLDKNFLQTSEESQNLDLF